MKRNFSRRWLQNKKTVLGISITVNISHWKKPDLLNNTVTIWQVPYILATKKYIKANPYIQQK